jgi:acyl-CoA hydrolase
MEAKRVRDSIFIMPQLMNPQDANIAGNVHGGVAAFRNARANVVTASIDRLDFHNSVFIGDFVTLRAGVNFVGKTSLEVGVRVEAKKLQTGIRRHTASTYLTFVALDSNGQPLPLPPLLLKTDEEKRRNREAE